MNIHGSRRLGRDAAQRLLRGEAAGPDRLAELLAAAAAPTHRDEQFGEEAAVSAFREARLIDAVQPRRRSMIKTTLAKLLTLKLAAAALTVTAAGGISLAAGTGHLPGYAKDRAKPTAQRTPDHTDGTQLPAKPSPGRDGHPGADPSPSLVGLCHAYGASAGHNPGKALDNPAFTHLISVAGGKSKVTAYCTALLKTHPGQGQGHAHSSGGPAAHHPHPTHPKKPDHPAH